MFDGPAEQPYHDLGVARQANTRLGHPVPRPPALGLHVSARQPLADVPEQRMVAEAYAEGDNKGHERQDKGCGGKGREGESEVEREGNAC